MEYLNTKRKIAFVPYPRTARQAEIMDTLVNEPLTLEEALPLLDELAELDTDMQRNPPEVGSPAWFAAIPEIPLEAK